MSVTRILHAVGDPASALAFAAHPAVDAIEVDVWVQDGEFAWRRPGVRSRLPGRGGVAQDAHVDVRVLLEALAGRVGLFLAVHDGRNDPAPEVARALHSLSDRSGVVLRCDSRAVADRLQAWLPDARVADYITTERALRRYVAERIRGVVPQQPLVLLHSLLHSRSEVEAAHVYAGWVAASDVEHSDRARELATWHVDAISSPHITVLDAV